MPARYRTYLIRRDFSDRESSDLCSEKHAAALTKQETSVLLRHLLQHKRFFICIICQLTLGPYAYRGRLCRRLTSKSVSILLYGPRWHCRSLANSSHFWKPGGGVPVPDWYSSASDKGFATPKDFRDRPSNVTLTLALGPLSKPWLRDSCPPRRVLWREVQGRSARL